MYHLQALPASASAYRVFSPSGMAVTPGIVKIPDNAPVAATHSYRSGRDAVPLFPIQLPVETTYNAKVDARMRQALAE